MHLRLLKGLRGLKVYVSSNIDEKSWKLVIDSQF